MRDQRGIDRADGVRGAREKLQARYVSARRASVAMLTVGASLLAAGLAMGSPWVPRAAGGMVIGGALLWLRARHLGQAARATESNARRSVAFERSLQATDRRALSVGIVICVLSAVGYGALSVARPSPLTWVLFGVFACLALLFRWRATQHDLESQAELDAE